jgi:hypothetical protein
MTPEEKADYLISCFKRYDSTEDDFEFALDDAIFCVENIIEVSPSNYWLQVKNELIKIRDVKI